MVFSEKAEQQELPSFLHSSGVFQIVIISLFFFMVHTMYPLFPSTSTTYARQCFLCSCLADK